MTNSRALVLVAPIVFSFFLTYSLVLNLTRLVDHTVLTLLFVGLVSSLAIVLMDVLSSSVSKMSRVKDGTKSHASAPGRD